MPCYEYECTKCGHSFELEQKISDRPRERCPKCRGKVIRVISGGGGVILKGKGFYSTDYRSESYKKAARAEDSGHGGSTGGEKKKKDD
jgi:putative FmdB family regulatory protein